MPSQPGGSADALEILEIEVDDVRYADAKEIRFGALYGELGLPRHLVEDTDGRTYRHLVAIVQGEVAGYGRIHMAEDPPKVFQLVVAASHQGLGVGTAILSALEGIARQDQREEVVLDARVHVVGFYEGVGYEVYGDEFISPRTGTPHRKMRRTLG